MNTLNIQLSPAEVSLVLELLKPYAELSVSLSNQYKAQLINATKPVRAKKVMEEVKPEDNTNANN